MRIEKIGFTQWAKEDPTEYDISKDVIRVRSTYDIDNDPEGWIVHERIHAYLASIKFEDNNKTYPFNDVERHAFTWQFVYLLETGRVKSIDNIEFFMPWKFERYGDEWANDYFSRALAKVRNDDPDMPPNIIHGGGRFESCAEQQLEEKFRAIVDDAELNILQTAGENGQASVTQKESNGMGCMKAFVVIAILIIALAVYCTF